MPDNQDLHISTFDAMRFIDCEMTAPERAALHQHLRECSDCQALVSETRERLGDLHAIVSRGEATSSDLLQAKDLLEAKLLETTENRHKFSWFPSGLLQRSRSLRFALPAIMGAVLLGVVGLRYWIDRSGLQTVALLPNTKLTPGAVRSVDLVDLCHASDDDDLDPAVPIPTQMRVFYEYGLSATESKKNFQVDYLINPQLGGVDDVRNLWPQPYNSPEWNARAKDSLERHLHQMVCEKKIELADAQREIAVNWIDAYKKYFHTSKPI
jgi:hypothetical protein